MNSKGIKIRKYNAVFFNDKEVCLIGGFILIVIFLNYSLVSFFLIFKISQTFLVFPLAVFLSIAFSLYNKISFRNVLVILSVIILLLIIMLINNYIFDFSIDGMGYHKETILELSEGWNPFYEKLEKEKMFLYTYNHYVKGIEFSQYSIYSFTKSIESAKVINFMFLFSALCFTYLAIKKIFNKTRFSILFTLFLMVNPIVINQILTFYVDQNIYFSFLIYSSLLILYSLNAKVRNTKYFIVMILVLFVNIKLTAVVFISCTSLLYFIYMFFIKDFEKIKALLKLFVYAAVLIVTVSWFPFVTNFVDKGNPIYPTVGEGKIDMIIDQTPSSLKDINPIRATFKSLFSKVNNAPFSYSNELVNENLEEFKIPFSFDFNEIKYSTLVDTRLAGFGFWFSGFFVISVFLSIVLFFLLRGNSKKYFLGFCVFIVLISLILVKGAWWARLVPHLWVFPITVFFVILYCGNKTLKIISRINLILVGIMVLCISGYNYNKALYNSYQKYESINLIRRYSEGNTMKIKPFFHSDNLLLKQYKVNYELITKDEVEQGPYDSFSDFYLLKEDIQKIENSK